MALVREYVERRDELIMLTKKEVNQAEIKVYGRHFTVTHIPTTTSGSWFTVHDVCEVWGAVAIDDLSGEVVGWRNPPADIPNTKPGAFRKAVEKAIKAAFNIPVKYGGKDRLNGTDRAKIL